MKLSFRQVHLDFHTTEKIDGIGEKFSKGNFQQALKIGHLSSITVFSKCHHGWAYHPSNANDMHPNLKFDLLQAQIDAAHEIGVKTPVYLSAGLDEKEAARHPEWLHREKNESTGWTRSFYEPGFHLFCFNSPYLDCLLAQIEEVVQNYDADGIFLDIVGVTKCYCNNCRNELIAQGKDPSDEDEVLKQAERVYINYFTSVRQAIDKHKPGLPLFQNSSHIRRGRRDLVYDAVTHLELESLPTGGWGYDHFPLSAAYARTLGLEFLGMTGKFHGSWGEFGGFKHKNALIYETALSAANGAKSSIGDQLAPNGEMDMATYELIGSAYKELEEKEPWIDNVHTLCDVALLSEESVQNLFIGKDMAATQSPIGYKADTGAVRILLEGKYLFNVVDPIEDFSKYKVVILPDTARLNDELQGKLKQFVAGGGKVLATGESGLYFGKDEFGMDFGVKYEGKTPYQPDYFRPDFKPGEGLFKSAFVFYSEGEKVSLIDGKELGKRENPYFNRTFMHFCSHRNTPCSGEYGGPGMVEGKDGIYIAWKVFSEYAEKGSLILKETVKYALDTLLGDNKTIKTNLPAQGVITLMQQDAQKRYITHMLYACPVKRGDGVEVVEDIIPMYNTEFTINVDRPITDVYLAPQMEKIPFIQEEGKVKFVVDQFTGHQMAVLDY